MKLRRSLALAAATAVIAPVALLSAPAAYATTPTPTPTATETVTPSGTPTPPVTPSATPTATESVETTPSQTPGTPTKSPETTPSSPAATTPGKTPSGTPAPTASENPGEGEDLLCEEALIDVSISGLPGKIAAGSGWHSFNMNILNKSDRTLDGVAFFAGASSDALGENLFTTKQVELQAYDESTKTWYSISEDGQSAGYVGETDSLAPDYEVDVKLRLNVKPGAPAGAGFSLGGGAYLDEESECFGFGETSYKFQIVKAGTDTSGTKPQEGGKTPLPSGKPATGSVPQVTGSLAETGASSQLPMFGIAGGAAVALGAGALFIVRRRKSEA
ncbi:LAETG motif-containing sortase-dependent surface protein [Streptomyces candidus]|uniref:LPXTG-motif cell wall-anchored protein n=1 Tax=Streptomyces candidus TaxID=67283 RepID=A0A7X0HCI1_9ACTN|nr:LAETG motif-containing sortase-dependent surface protein [Streptomyces candidus]MBB6434981.1 LPXTG-motif cell wall-anchored protein [Streptomyces candidus]GHH41145.1 hypothetical protein GCM10018773_23880 [Streptomyces candidus]